MSRRSEGPASAPTATGHEGHEGHERARPARPRTVAQIEIDRSVPGWVLHAALGVVILTGLLVGMAGSEVSPALVGVAAVGLAAGTVGNAVRPGFGVGAIALGLMLLPFVLTAPVGYSWRTPVLMVLVHAVVRLSWLCTVAGPRTRVETAVLVAEGRRSAVLNLVGQLVALVAGGLTALAGSTPSTTWPWFAVLGAAAVLALALLLRNGLPTGHDVSGRQR